MKELLQQKKNNHTNKFKNNNTNKYKNSYRIST